MTDCKLGADPRRTALVTGASRGIGAAIARHLARDGWDLVLVARSNDELRALAASLSREYGVQASALVTDLALPGAAVGVFDALRERATNLDLLVNNAGVGDYGEFWQRETTVLETMLGLNVCALTRLTRLALPGMIERRRGAILNIASTAALRPGPMMSVYTATKAYVVSFTESLACELDGTGVRAVAICPGPTASAFSTVACMPMVRSSPSRRVARAEDLAAFAVDALTRSGVVAIHGARNKAWILCLRFLPRALQGRIVRWSRRGDRQSAVTGQG